jgi:hypothetical protein
MVFIFSLQTSIIDAVSLGDRLDIVGYDCGRDR